MVIFHSYVSLPEGIIHVRTILYTCLLTKNPPPKKMKRTSLHPVVSALRPSLPKGSEHLWASFPKQSLHFWCVLLSHRDVRPCYRKFMENQEDSTWAMGKIILTLAALQLAHYGDESPITNNLIHPTTALLYCQLNMGCVDLTGMCQWFDSRTIRKRTDRSARTVCCNHFLAINILRQAHSLQGQISLHELGHIFEEKNHLLFEAFRQLLLVHFRIFPNSDLQRTWQEWTERNCFRRGKHEETIWNNQNHQEMNGLDKPWPHLAATGSCVNCWPSWSIFTRVLPSMPAVKCPSQKLIT